MTTKIARLQTGDGTIVAETQFDTVSGVQSHPLPSGGTAQDHAPPFTIDGVPVFYGAGLISIKDPTYGAIGDGTHDDTAAIQAAITAGEAVGQAIIYFPPGVYKITSQLTLAGAITLLPWPGVKLVYSGGATSAIKCSGWTGKIHHGFIIDTTAQAGAHGIEVGNASRNCQIDAPQLIGNNTSANTGSAIYLKAGTGVSIGLVLVNVQWTGYKWGVKGECTDLSAATWTAITGFGNVGVGRAAGPIAGGAGYLFDQFTNGVGSEFVGGSCESYDIGVQHLNGGVGGKWSMDFEGNNTLYAIGATFNGWIKQAAGGQRIERWCNGSSNGWTADIRDPSGDWTTQSRGNRIHTFTDNGSVGALWGVDYGDASGNNTTPGFYVALHTSGDVEPGRNYMQLLNWKAMRGAALPTVGDHEVGDYIKFTGYTAGQPLEQLCTSRGTDGALSGVTATTTASSPDITVSSSASLHVGQFVTIAGVTTPASGGFKILSIAGTAVVLDANADASISGAAMANAVVAWTSPEWLLATVAKGVDTSGMTTVSIANNASITLTTKAYGMVLISNAATSATLAVFIFDGGGNVVQLGVTATGWWTTASGSSGRLNVFKSGSNLTLENKLGPTTTVRYAVIAVAP